MSITFTSVANPWCLSRILYPNFFHPGSWICIKELMCFNPKQWFLSSRKYDPGCSSRTRILTFYQFRIPDPQHWFIRRLAVRQARVQFSPQHPPGRFFPLSLLTMEMERNLSERRRIYVLHKCDGMSICTKRIKINKWFIYQKRKRINKKYI